MTKVFKRKKLNTLLMAFLLSAGIFLLLLIRHHIVPFGGTTLLISDLDTQYVEFMAEYRRILLGQGSLFWSWHAGLGMNFIALIAYYLASPFNFLLPLFPENQLPLAVSVLTILKLGCAGAAFASYLLTHYQKQPGSILIPAFSACYALSAYALGYAFNIMWLDAMIWLPLLCAGIDRLLTNKNKSMTTLTLLFALTFLSQFYMASMTGVFCALYFLTQILNKRFGFREFFRNAVQFGMCVLIAAGLSAFLLLPTFFVLKNNMGLLGQEFPAPEGQFPFLQIFSKLFIGSFDGIKDCLPHIYCGLPALLGMIMYFTRKSISAREKLFSGLLTLILLFSFWFKPLDFLWHAMDHPSWFPFRYAFIFCFWVLTLAYQGFASNSTETIKIFESARNEAHGDWHLVRRSPHKCACPHVLHIISEHLQIILIPFVTAVLILIAAGFSMKDISPAFFLINGGFLIAYALFQAHMDSSEAAAQQAQQNRTRDALILTLLVSVELFINGSMIISVFSGGYTKNADFQSFHEQYHFLTKAVQPESNEFYRMEKDEYRNYNDALGIGYPGISHFSSTASTRQAEFLKRLGFNCYATWCTYEGSTAATDTLLGIRYEFWNTGKQDSLPAGTETWERPSVFPLFFFAEDDFARYDFFSDADAITRQNDLLRLLNGEKPEDFFTPIPVKITKSENLKEIETNEFVKIDSKQPAFYEAEIKPVANSSLYLSLPGASLSHTVIVNDTELMNGNRDYAPFPICLDAFTAEDTINIRIEAVKDRLEGGIKAYALDTARLTSLSEKVNETAPLMERTGSTTFLLKTDASQEERLIVSSIPFDAGWRVKINGQPQPLKMIHESVLGFTLPAGMESAEISYRLYGFDKGLILTGIALLFLPAVFLLDRYSAPEAHGDWHLVLRSQHKRACPHVRHRAEACLSPCTSFMKPNRST